MALRDSSHTCYNYSTSKDHLFDALVRGEKKDNLPWAFDGIGDLKPNIETVIILKVAHYSQSIILIQTLV